MRRQLPLLALAVVLLAACSSGKKASGPTPTSSLFGVTTTTALPASPVVASILSPAKGSVQGSGGRGMVVALTFTAKDPSALPAQFRLGGALPSPATAAKPGHNPAFPGLVVVANSTSTALGGPTANLANLFQIVSPALQADGSVQVTAVWTNADTNFGSDVDVTLIAFTVTGAAPDTIPVPPTDLTANSNGVQVTFRLAGGDAAAAASTTTTTVAGTKASTTTTAVGATTTTTKPAASTTSTTKPAAATTTTTVPATTTTTKFLGLF